MDAVFLGLGSNLGDRRENLRRALEMLGSHISISKKSSVYESEAMYVRQPRFYNMVVAGTTTLLPLQLLGRLKSIEESMGREQNTHNLPRPIDIDIIFYGDTVIESPELTIPHARMHERPFVLSPLVELDPYLVHPHLQQPVIDLEDNLGISDDIIWKVDEL